MIQKKFSYEELTEKFLQFEEKHQLLYLRICDVLPGQIARVSLFLRVVEFYIPGNSSPTKVSLFSKFKTLLRRGILNNIFYNPFLDFTQSDILIFESGRKYMSYHGYIDIYTYHLNRYLINKGKSTKVYEVFFNENEKIFKNTNTKHLDFIRFSSYLKQRKIECIFNEQEVDIIEKISLAFEQEFGIKIDFKQLFTFEIKRFKAEYSLYNKLFILKKPKEIFIINSCDKPAMVFAAKQNHIIVNELQHGLNSDKDVILNFPYTEEDSLDYFPNRFYEWDNVNMFFAKLPLSFHNIIKFPNLNIQHLLEELKTTPKEKNNILIISQPYGSEEIQQYILKSLPKLGLFQIIYKAHPVENMQKMAEFEKKCEGFSNIRVVNNSESIYQLMKKAQYVVGIYSSSLFEAVAFDCKIILLNLPGVEMSFPLLEDANNQLIGIEKELSVYLTE
ncbi:hypothetical protein [Soonwooa purpurea]